MRKEYLSLIVLALMLTAFTLSANAQIEFIIQYDDGNSVYYSGRPQPGDTCGVWFEPPTESQILSGLFQFNNGMGGAADVFITYLADGFDPSVYYDNDESGWPGQAASPIGEFLTPAVMPIQFDDSGNWQEIVFADYGYLPEDLDVGIENFYLGYRLTGGGAEPYLPSILGDAGDDRPYHSLCYIDPGGMYAGEYGWWAYGIDWMLRAKVNMYGDPPPEITGLVDLPDTYASGPYTISATITDQIQGGSPGVVAEARLIYAVDGGDEVIVIMTDMGGDVYEGDIPAVGIGSMINFRVEADDDQNHTSIAPSLAGYNFTFRQPSGAPILLVSDVGDTDSDAFYLDALDNNGFSYDYWYIGSGDANDMGYAGTDVFSTANYQTILWFNGTANSGSLPNNAADLATDPIANFMDDGGSFFLTSSDYLGGAFDPAVWTEFTAEPGTFMYEYLKVLDGWSDAHVGGALGESQDTLHFGIAGDPISDEFSVDGICSHPDPNWNDFCYPRDGGVTCFVTEIDEESAGIRYDVDYKMVFLPWVLEAADDLGEAETVLLNIIDFLGSGNPGPGISIMEGSRYGIYGDTPHEVIVELDDPDGIGGAAIKLSWDNEAFLSETMTDIGNNQYEYVFASTPAGWSTLDYRVVATDGLGNPAANELTGVWSTGLEYSAGANLLFFADQPYNEAYGVPNQESKITDALDAIPAVTYQLWDVDMYGIPDYWTVLTNYDHCIWVGLYDWIDTFPQKTWNNPFSRFLSDGKDLLFSSEEMVGTWTGWEYIDFHTGDFLRDWMHVGAINHDLGYDMLETQSDDMTVGLSSTLSLTGFAGIPIFTDAMLPMPGESVSLFTADGGTLLAGIRDDVDQHNAVFLPFCLFMMDEQAELNMFLDNVIDYWIAHPGSYVGVEPEPEAVPLVYSLKQNYPNPFNPVTEINFSLPELANVELTVYNLMGQEVAKLLDRKMNPGSHHVTFDASQLSSGVYFYKLKTADFEKAMKMILVK